MADSTPAQILGQCHPVLGSVRFPSGGMALAAAPPVVRGLSRGNDLRLYPDVPCQIQGMPRSKNRWLENLTENGDCQDIFFCFSKAKARKKNNCIRPTEDTDLLAELEQREWLFRLIPSAPLG